MRERELDFTKNVNVTCAIIQKDGKILITRRAPGQALSGQWEFPGGKVELGESLEGCLAREIQEELGIKIQVGKLVLEFSHDYKRPDGRIVRFFAFECQFLAGEPTLSVHDQLAWVTLEELPHFDFLPADLQLVKKLLDTQNHVHDKITRPRKNINR